MKKIIKTVALILSLMILAGTLSACSLSEFFEGDKLRPKLDFNTNIAERAILFLDGKRNEKFMKSCSLTLQGDHFADYFNVDYSECDYGVNIATVVFNREKGKSGFVLASVRDANGEIDSYIEALVALEDKKVCIERVGVDGSIIVLSEYELKNDTVKVGTSVVLTAEYDKGVINFWIDDLLVTDKSVDLNTLSLPSFVCDLGFVSVGADTSMKYIKSFGKMHVTVFKPSSLYEGCENLAAHCTYSPYRGSSDCFDAGDGYVKKLQASKAGGLRINGIDLAAGEPLLIKYTCNTHVARKAWQGARMGFLKDQDGVPVKIYSMEGSYGIFKDEKSFASASLNREFDTDYHVMLLCRDNHIWFWIDEELVIDNVSLPGGSTYSPDFFAFFEFGEVDITDYFVCRPNDVTIY